MFKRTAGSGWLICLKQARASTRCACGFLLSWQKEAKPLLAGRVPLRPSATAVPCASRGSTRESPGQKTRVRVKWPCFVDRVVRGQSRNPGQSGLSESSAYSGGGPCVWASVSRSPCRRTPQASPTGGRGLALRDNRSLRMGIK